MWRIYIVLSADLDGITGGDAKFTLPVRSKMCVTRRLGMIGAPPSLHCTSNIPESKHNRRDDSDEE